MQVEHDIKIVPLDENFDKELQQMQADGWKPAPGFPPFAVYPVVRDQSVPVQPPGFGGVASGHIDDSKAFIRKPDGKMYRADGTEVIQHQVIQGGKE